MILRVLTLAAGLAGAVGFSQFPEFSQQYVQRLGGAVDALGQVVAEFDASATAAGLTRDAALAQMTGTDFLDRRQDDMAATFARHDRLRADLAALQGEGPFVRAYRATRFRDSDIARAAWAAFQPAMPLTFAGLSFAGVGFLAGLFLMTVLRRLGALVRRRSATSGGRLA